MAITVVAGAAAPAVAEPSAAASEGTLAVTTLDRAGAAFQEDLSVAPLDNPGAIRTMTSGTSHSLPAGQYALITSSFDGDPVLVTLGVRIVSITTGTTTAVTVDARQGREVHVTLKSGDGSTLPGPGYAQGVGARVCVAGHDFGVAGQSNAGPGQVWVIPNDDPRTQLGYISNWTSNDDPDAYTATGTVPLTGDPITVPIAETGTVSLALMRGASSQGSSLADVFPSSGDPGCHHDLYAPAGPMPTPSARFHMTAGNWQFGVDTWHGSADVTAGSNTSLDFGRAVWGPTRYLPWVRKGELGFFTSGMVADPLIPGVDPTIVADATLYRNGKAVVTKTGLGNSPSAKGPKTFWAPITASAAYTLKVHGRRYAAGVPQPAGMLSTATDAVFSFHAGPTSNAVPPAFLTHFLPSGLDLYNRVPADRAASLPLLMDRTSTQAGVPMWPATVKKVEVFGSTDGGASWHPLTVTHTGGTWAAQLPAQRSGASLSLSSRVTDTGGNQTVTTVYRAFTTAAPEAATAG